MFPYVLLSFVVGTIPVSVACAAVMQRHPLWRPEQYVPALGMLLGNAISAVGVSTAFILVRPSRAAAGRIGRSCAVKGGEALADERVPACACPAQREMTENKDKIETYLAMVRCPVPSCPAVGAFPRDNR